MRTRLRTFKKSTIELTAKSLFSAFIVTVAIMAVDGFLIRALYITLSQWPLLEIFLDLIVTVAFMVADVAEMYCIVTRYLDNLK